MEHGKCFNITVPDLCFPTLHILVSHYEPQKTTVEEKFTVKK